MEELARLRMERGWSQQRLADESSVNKATINQIERGRRSPNVDTLEKLAAALGVGVADFFPKAQASLWSDSMPTERRSSILPEALIATVDKWIEIVSEPGTSNGESFGITRAAGILGDSIEDLADDASWESLPSREQHQIMRVMENLTEVFRRVNQRIEDENLEEEFRQQQEKIREWTRRISA